jgi:hypothetical protein
MLLLKKGRFPNDDDDDDDVIFPKHLGERRKPLISTVDILAKIGTGYLPNVRQKRHRLSEHGIRYDKTIGDEQCRVLQEEPLVF